MAFFWRVASWTLCSVNNSSNCSRRQGTDIAGFAKMQAEKETNTNPIKTNKRTKNNPQSKQHPLKATRHCLRPVANVPSGLKTEWGSPPRAGVCWRAGGALEVGAGSTEHPGIKHRWWGIERNGAHSSAAVVMVFVLPPLIQSLPVHVKYRCVLLLSL